MGVSGALLIALGIICICHPGATILSASFIIGIMTLASGISTIITWGRLKNLMPTGNLLLAGILEVVVGLIFLNNNMFLAATLPIIFACWILAEGIILAVRSFDFKKFNFKSWWVLLVLGIATAVVGFFSLKEPFDVAAPILTYCIGAAIILLGVVEIVLLCEINKLEDFTYSILPKE